MDYLEKAIQILQEIQQTQGHVIEKAAQVIADALQKDHMVYIFGASHAGILAQEMFYRAGGLVPVNPIFPPGLTTDVRPVTLTSKLERLAGFGTQILSETSIAAGDVVIVHSVSGRNAAAVEVAQGAHDRGATIIAITSLQYSRSVAPRQPGMPRLFEMADLVMDDFAPIGDALIELPGQAQRAGPISTVTGAALLNAVVVRVAEILIQQTGNAPIFMSANLDGGDEHNRRWLDHYRGRLTYLM